MVPQGIYLPFRQVVQDFKQTHPNVSFKSTVDTPEEMAHMVEENPTKPDIFISPGGHELEVLRGKGFIDPKSEVAFGSYELALLVPSGNPGKIHTLEDLAKPEVKMYRALQSRPECGLLCRRACLSRTSASGTRSRRRSA